MKHRKYARWKATYIHNCLKNGETPQAGPVGIEEDNGMYLFIEVKRFSSIIIVFSSNHTILFPPYCPKSMKIWCEIINLGTVQD